MRSRNKKGHSLSDPQTAGFAGFFRRRAHLSLRRTLNRGLAVDLGPFGDPCPRLLPLIPPGSLLLRMTILENRRVGGPRQQLAPSTQNSAQTCTKWKSFLPQTTIYLPVQPSLGCPRAPARLSEVTTNQPAKVEMTQLPNSA
jgi:hypothetical protein